jgi:hypothetical protein
LGPPIRFAKTDSGLQQIALETDCNQYLVPETAGKYKLLLNVGAVGWITEGLTEPGAKTPPFAWYYVL